MLEPAAPPTKVCIKASGRENTHVPEQPMEEQRWGGGGGVLDCVTSDVGPCSACTASAWPVAPLGLAAAVTVTRQQNCEGGRQGSAPGIKPPC